MVFVHQPTISIPCRPEMKARILTTNISLDEGTCFRRPAEEAAEYFRFGITSGANHHQGARHDDHEMEGRGAKSRRAGRLKSTAWRACSNTMICGEPSLSEERHRHSPVLHIHCVRLEILRPLLSFADGGPDLGLAANDTSKAYMAGRGYPPAEHGAPRGGIAGSSSARKDASRPSALPGYAHVGIAGSMLSAARHLRGLALTPQQLVPSRCGAGFVEVNTSQEVHSHTLPSHVGTGQAHWPKAAHRDVRVHSSRR